MKRTWSSRAVAVSSVALLGAMVASFASCATNAGDGTLDEDASSAVPEAAAPELDGAVSDALPPEAGCDASDPGCTSEMLRCEDVAWCLVPTPATPKYALTAIWGSRQDDVWAVGSGGTILHYDGATWVETVSGTPETLLNVWGSGPEDVWVVGRMEMIFHSDGFADGGARWELVPAAGNPEPDFTLGYTTMTGGRAVRAIWGSSASDVRIGTPIPFSIETYVPPEFFYSGSSTQLVRGTSDGGLAWRPLPGNHRITSIWGSSATDVWIAADDLGSLRGTMLHGTPYEGPAPHPDIEEAATFCFGCEAPCPSCDKLTDPLVWTPVDSQSNLAFEAIWGSSADDVWAVGEGGTIRRIRKGDVRWQKVDSPTSAPLHAVWGSGPDDVWIAGDSGTILHYDGTTLEPSSVQLPLGPRPHLRGVWGSGPNDVWIVGDGVLLHYTGPKAGGAK